MKKPLPFFLLTTLMIFLWSSCVGPLEGSLLPGAETEITRVVVKEKAGVTSSNYPLSFGHVFRRGDLPRGSEIQVYLMGEALPSQFDPKSSYPDGSIRHGVISVRVPRIVAHSEIQLSLVRSSRPNSSQALDKAAILATDLGATMELSGLGLTADLRKAINDSAQLNYWLQGEVCTEILVRQDLNGSLNALWEVRLYPGTPYIRISHTIENVNLSSRGNVHYGLSISQGHAKPQRVYEKAPFQHNHSSRWRKVFWLGNEPPELEIRFDLPYMISTGMILPYDTSLQINESAIVSNYNAWRASNRDIMGNGSIYMSMPAGGGRPDIGMLPRWTALYLLTMDNRMREVMLSNGEMSGHIPIHYREDNPANSFYGRIISIGDRESFYWLNNNSLPSNGDVSGGGWSPDMPHQPSLVYVPYLITGERLYLDELYYWAGFNLFYNSQRRPGDSYGPGYNRSFGLISTELRGVAWGLRTISDALAMAPDSDPEKAYLRSKLVNNVTWLAWRNEAPRGHGVNLIIWSGSGHSSPSWPTSLISPWQHDFMVLSIAHISRQHADIAQATVLRDTIGKFTIDRFYQLPEYQGVAYRMPLNDLQGEYYRSSGWTQYAADMAAFMGNANPQTYFNSQDYAYSYAFIALGASAVVSHLNRGLETYTFIRNNVSYQRRASDDPTWAFAPLQ